MTSIYPLPTTRSSNLLAQSRLIDQLQSDQLDILRLQTQLSTGIRLQVPSDDPTAALQGIDLQRLISLNAQAQTNNSTSQSYLSATDSTLANVATLLNQVQSTALGAVGTTASDSDRQAALATVASALQSLLNTANQQVNGRYLFGGSLSGQIPYSQANGGVVYSGNENSLYSYSDTNLLTATNTPGSQVFGAYSPQVRGATNLHPITTGDTLLSDLNGGLGVKLGKILVSDGANASLVDLSHASTLGDVAALLNAHPPAGRNISARVTSQGLVVNIDFQPGTNLTISDTPGGATALGLGIARPLGAGSGSILGGPLNPRLQPTTLLSEAFGVRANAALPSPGQNNDLLLEAKQVGAGSNGLSVHYVDDSLLHAGPPLSPGSEVASYSGAPTAASAGLTLNGGADHLILTATTPGSALNQVQIQIVNGGFVGNNPSITYNPGAKTLTIGVATNGVTTVQNIVDAINSQGTFTAAADAAGGGYTAGNNVTVVNNSAASGNTGNSGADANSILVRINPGATTASGVLAALQANPAVASQLNVQLDATDSSSAALAGTGFVDVNSSASLSQGGGAALDTTSGVQVVNGGKTYTIDLSQSQTIEDILNAFNTSPANVLAQINAAGTGIDVRSRLAGGDFSIGENGGTTATQLGIRSFTTTTRLSDLNYGRGVASAAGPAFSITRTDGTQFSVDVSSAATVGDVLNLINNNPANQAAGNQVTAQLTTVGNGLQLTQASAPGAGAFQVVATQGNQAAIDLGLIPPGQTQSAVGAGAPLKITGGDVNPQEVQSVFNSLLRLQTALTNNDVAGVSRATALLKTSSQQVTSARADAGLRSQQITSINTQLVDQKTQLSSTLSTAIDTDFGAAVSELQSRTATLQATLQLSAKTYQLSLLNYL